MSRNWTFGQKVAAGLVVTVALTVCVGAVAITALRAVVEAKDRLITTDAQTLIDAARLDALVERKVAASRGYLLAKDERFLERMREARAEYVAIAARLKERVHTEEGRRLLRTIEETNAAYREGIQRVLAMRRADAGMDVIAAAYEQQILPRRDELTVAVHAFVTFETKLLDDAKRESTQAASTAIAQVVAISAVAAIFALMVAFALGRTLNRQVGAVIGQVQSSSAELQAAANQQATGAKEQATAMNEITTTISELLATSRQIAASAQRVAHIAEQTATAARAGDALIESAHESIAGIRRQVEQIVIHMLELGKKSQQIGSVLEIVSEMAEQTNILAINATIEATGAGEAGKRFAVVADEIRKLADRVTASTKEIRTLIDDVRGAVNTTVMATETGSKTVERGTKQFGEVAASFKQIVGLVSTTTEASREIELSTKQQATAVEQVNVAITNVAQVTKETEASSTQTLQTASQLTVLSRDLQQIVEPRAAA